MNLYCYQFIVLAKAKRWRCATLAGDNSVARFETEREAFEFCLKHNVQEYLNTARQDQAGVPKIPGVSWNADMFE